jgi:hypothetical protein
MDAQTLLVELTPDEAADLLAALLVRADEDYADPGWHTHITDSEGRELTIAVSGDARFANRFAKPS